MAGDDFVTVAIAYRQPQAAVLLSLFEWHGIPAVIDNYHTVFAIPKATLALGGMPVRVHVDWLGEALDLLATAEEECRTAPDASVRRHPGLALTLLLALFGVVPPPRLPAVLLWKRAPAAPNSV